MKINFLESMFGAEIWEYLEQIWL